MTELQAADEFEYLQSPRAIRERTAAVFDWIASGKSECFRLDLARLPDVARDVIALARESYGDFSRVPFHSRWRHLDADGGVRSRELAARLGPVTQRERLCTEADLVLVSVLLDAGSGPQWKYRAADGTLWSRSEGLAVASYDAFLRGELTSGAQGAPSVTAERLLRVTTQDIEAWFQVTADNPLVGTAGRAELLGRLGRVVQERSDWFLGSVPRPGSLLLTLADRGAGGVAARDVLAAVLDGLGAIWPSRLSLGGKALGDVWQHPAVGLVPFHKLSQWLSYSLCETLQRNAVPVTGVEQLTGLAEYRNGGLFLDTGVLQLRDETAQSRSHAVDSLLVVEWRAATVALLDRTAELVRHELGLDAAQLPLACVLEGGTWALGRKVAARLRPGGGPPIQVQSDGTVF